MATSATESKRSIDYGTGDDDRRAITDDRFTRALTEPMVVVFDAPLFSRVRHGDETYQVDLVSGMCDCPDAIHRGHSIVCKHAIRAALASLYGDGRVSEFVARVAAYAREAGCPNDVRGCHGPTTPADRAGSLPCQQCIEAVRAPAVDEYTVWSAFAAPDQEAGR